MNLADGTYQVSYDMGIEENGEISWSHYSSKLYFIKRNNTIYAETVSLTGNFTSVHKIYFDNIGISKANPTNALYIKYNSMSGTSMAAPQVSAAAALLAAAYPNDSAVQRRNRLLNCVREVSGLSSYCMTGGILDLSKIIRSPCLSTDHNKDKHHCHCGTRYKQYKENNQTGDKNNIK